MSFTKTFLFKNLIPDFESYKKYRDEYIPDFIDLTENNQLFLFRLIYNNFCNCSVAFDTPDSFYRNFYLKLWDVGESYISKLEKIKLLKSISIDELTTELESITNFAQNDNELNTAPLTDLLPYITNQTNSRSKLNKALAINRAIELYRENACFEFLNKFKNLFLTLHGNDVILYNRGC